MNGYERHSKDYGGPPVGWATRLMVIVVIGIVAGSAIIGLWRFVST